MGKCFSLCVSNSAISNTRNLTESAGDHCQPISAGIHNNSTASQLLEVAATSSEKYLFCDKDKMPITQKRQLHSTSITLPNSAKKSKVSNKQHGTMQNNVPATVGILHHSASFEDTVFSLFSQYATLLSSTREDNDSTYWPCALPTHSLPSPQQSSLQPPPSSWNNYIMTVDGVVSFLEHLGFSHDDFRVLLFAWYCQASMQCQFSWSEFLHGCQSLHATTLPILKDRLNTAMLAVNQDENRFTIIYKWAFTYCLEEHQRCLDKEMALAMWKVVFTVNPVGNVTMPMVHAWLEFIRDNHAIKAISQDTWDMFLKFLQVVGRDISLYNESDAWPTLMDEFMECQLQSGSAILLNNNNTTTRSAAHCTE